jgi:hypothetical protein
MGTFRHSLTTSTSLYERFSDRAQKVMRMANQETQRLNHEYVGTEHILLGLIREKHGVAANVLKNLNVDLMETRMAVEKLTQRGPDMVTMGKLPLTTSSKRVIEYAMEESRNLQHNYVGTEHILLGLLREQEGVSAQVLVNLGLPLREVRNEVLNLIGHGVSPEQEGFSEKVEAGPIKEIYEPDEVFDKTLCKASPILSGIVDAIVGEMDNRDADELEGIVPSSKYEMYGLLVDMSDKFMSCDMSSVKGMGDATSWLYNIAAAIVTGIYFLDGEIKKISDEETAGDERDDEGSDGTGHQVPDEDAGEEAPQVHEE